MAYAAKSQPALTLVVIFPLLLLWAYASATGFTTDLIPRDSPLSPLYNPSSTHYDRFHDAIQRSLKRINHFKGKFEAPLTPGGGEYVMKLSIGTPPVEFLGIADTGSDLTWTQCLPCTQCYKQTLPLFDPRRSSSYQSLSCDSDPCNALQRQGCSLKNTCEYGYGYGDRSYTRGDLATETFTIGNSNSNVALPKIAFGCGHANTGTFDKSSSGLIGLGGGNLSLVSQLGASGKKFSYCLTPKANSTSKISFGSDAVVSGSGVVTTPIITKSGEETFYYLSLEAVTVGNRRIAFAPKDKTRTSARGGDAVEGNIIIDSGTVLTLLPQDTFDDLVSALEEVISLPKADDPDQTLQLCYGIDGEGGDLGLPTVTAHFKGADVVLQPSNTFVLAADGIICLAALPADQLAIFGNIAQENFLVGYDLDAHTVSFKPTDCTKQE